MHFLSTLSMIGRRCLMLLIVAPCLPAHATESTTATCREKMAGFYAQTQKLAIDGPTSGILIELNRTALALQKRAADKECQQLVSLMQEIATQRSSAPATEQKAVDQAQSADTLPVEQIQPLQGVFRADSLRGLPVRNHKGHKIGVVSDVVVSFHDKPDVPFLIISRGSVLGVGGKRHPIPTQAIKLAQVKLESKALEQVILVDLPIAVLSDIPVIEDSGWGEINDPQWAGRIVEFYKQLLPQGE